MTLEEILDIDRYPFDRDVLNDDIQEYDSESFWDGYVRFILYVIYYNKFFMQVGIDLALQRDTLYLSYNILKGANSDIKLVFQRDNVNRNLFRYIMDWAGWKVCSKNADSVRTGDEGEWNCMMGCMPELKLDVDEMFSSYNVYCCWNERLANYLWFSKEHNKEIRSKFEKGDGVVREILYNIADPLQIDTGLIYFYLMKERYVIGFYEGSDDTYTASFAHLHPHFCINIVVLKYLLDYTQLLFEF